MQGRVYLNDIQDLFTREYSRGYSSAYYAPKPEVKAWMDEHISSQYRLIRTADGRRAILFGKEHDALVFKLRWG